MQISSFISDSYIINLCLGYQLCLICPLILLYFSTLLHRNPGIFSPYVWTLPSKSYLPFCLKQEYSYLCGQGGDGNNVIEKLPITATWSEIKAELCSVLGEGDPKRRAFENLSRYKPKSKGFGEMASDIMAQAAIATNDADLQTQLGLKAFLQAVPRNIGRELRRRHFNSVKEALEEARFLQSAEEEEDRDSGKICTIEAKAVPPVEEPKVNIQQIVEACVKQLQAQQPKKEQSERPRGSRKKYRCWCCGEDGHTLRDCPTILQNRAAYFKQPTTEQAEN